MRRGAAHKAVQHRTSLMRAVVQMLCEGAQGEQLIAAIEQYLHQHAPEAPRKAD